MRSGLEDKVRKVLNNKKVKFLYEPYSLSYVIEAWYTPDFVLTKKDGTDLIIETKGFFKPSDRRKMTAIKAAHPELDIRIVFQRDNYLTKSKKAKYTDWAKKNGFPCHVGEEIPDSWLSETANKKKK